ncbi:Pr6Pr family membrane protein [Phenylobacterium sp.]|uniref:Pr6Pr family membrane protein n=1 Tax=Phenylobacterium sp. TaxID=1871053 RepID=UPI00286CE123|nr:Pr6Pr family membrane protein [Phenylobacterium sp.]
MRAYRAIAALIAWFGLLLQYWLMVRGQDGEAFATRTVNFFSYFTILSNLFAAVMFTAPAAFPRSPIGLYFAKPAIRTAVTLYMSVTAATYIAILQGLWDPQGLQWVADTTLHYLTPGLVLLDWLLFTPKRTLRWVYVWPWLVFPLAYGVYSIVRGPYAGFYPYPFLDVSKLGLERVAMNMVAMTGLFLILGLILIAIDRAVKPRG